MSGDGGPARKIAGRRRSPRCFEPFAVLVALTLPCALARAQSAASFPVEPSAPPAPAAATPPAPTAPAATTPPAPSAPEPAQAAPSPSSKPPTTDAAHAPSTPAAPNVAPDPDALELERIRMLFEHYDRDFRHYQLWGSVSALAVSAVTIPAGIAFVHHDAEEAGIITLAIGAGAAVGAVVLMLGSSGVDTELVDIAAAANQARRSGELPKIQLERIEAAWKQRADDARAQRYFAGGAGLFTGALGFASGTYFTLAKPSDLSKNQQYGFAAACYGVGTLGLLVGVRAFFFESPSEIAWHTYQAGKGTQLSSLTVTNLVASPLPGGAELGVRASF
jgi:hypothetical protein